MKNSLVKAHFDHIAQNYDRYKHSGNFYYEELKRAVTDCIPGNQRVLEIGCGTGTLLMLSRPKFGLGVDISPAMIKHAQTKYSQQTQVLFKVHDIESTPLPKKFDYILLADVIEHLIDPQTAIKNITKSMLPASTLVLTMANPAWEQLLIILEKLHLKMPEGPHQRLKENELLHILNSNNLTAVSKHVYCPQVSLSIIHSMGLIYVYIIKKSL